MSTDWKYKFYVMDKNTHKYIYGFDDYEGAVKYAKQIDQQFMTKAYAADFGNPSDLNNWTYDNEYPAPNFD